MKSEKNIQDVAVNELRVLSAEMITNAKSGHPGIALGSAPIIYSLYANVMCTNPNNPKSIFRDRFVLSAGHGSSVLYATLFAMGYDIDSDDLKEFRKIGSKTPGHPEVNVTAGIDCSTGPLGQGIANAVGMAIAEKHLEAKYNKPDLKLFDNTVYCMTGDGCLMEGVAYEALSVAGTLNLDNLVLIYDFNKITIEGKTDLTFCEDIEMRFKAIGFDVVKVNDGNDTFEITDALLKAKKSSKPAIVIVPTKIGYGSELEGSEKSHGTPLSAEMLQKLKENLDVQKPDFDFSSGVKQHFEKKSAELKNRFTNRNVEKEYKTKYPNEYDELISIFEKKNFGEYINKISNIKATSSGSTRDINHEIMQQIAKIVPNLFGGSADVSTSTKAYVESKDCFAKDNYLSNYIHYGVREHAMGAISNGIALFGADIPYQSCFLTFMDYLKPALRMSALMNLPVLSVFSHDSLTAGQDGPTHQPVEQLPTLRLTPNLIVSRPYNASEILATYIWLLQNKKPTCMLVSKDKFDFVESNLGDALKGGYILKEDTDADITLIGTGSDVDKCLKIANILNEKGIKSRVVSIPSVSVFESQDMPYKQYVLGGFPKVFVEASAETYWYKLANKTDLVLNVTNFGKSGSPAEVEKYMQFDAESLSKEILFWLKNE